MDDANIDELLNVIQVGQPAEIHSDVVFQGPVAVSNMGVKGSVINSRVKMGSCSFFQVPSMKWQVMLRYIG